MFLTHLRLKSMADLVEHYENHLSDSYSWLYGGLEFGVSENLSFFETHSLIPCGSRIAVDLGCGSGFQSIPLAQLGYSVIALDQSEKLLNELRNNLQGLQIKTIAGDLINFRSYCPDQVELCVCMGDTLTHLDSLKKIQTLFSDVYDSLENSGRFVLTFRDLTSELKHLDRFIPVRSDDSKIFTCFLEYQEETVKVHDLIYEKIGDKWSLKKSFYYKLRISVDWVQDTLKQVGFSLDLFKSERGLVTILASKK